MNDQEGGTWFRILSVNKEMFRKDRSHYFRTSGNRYHFATSKIQLKNKYRVTALFIQILSVGE